METRIGMPTKYIVIRFLFTLFTLVGSLQDVELEKYDTPKRKT